MEQNLKRIYTKEEKNRIFNELAVVGGNLLGDRHGARRT